MEMKKGFEVGGKSLLLEAYADDITIFLTPNEQNLRATLNIFSNFYKMSGLAINIEKLMQYGLVPIMIVM